MKMPHTLEFRRPANAETEFGGNAVAANRIGGGVGFIQDAGAAEVKKYGKPDERIDVEIFLETDPGLKVGDVIVCLGNSEGSSYVNQRFIYRAEDDATAGHGRFFSVLATRVR